MRGAWAKPCFWLLVCVCFAVGGEVEIASFSELERQASRQWGGWHGCQQALSNVFQKERKRLGDRFEPELLKFVGRDVTKHYKTSRYLVAPGYLHGSKPLPHLALLLKHQAIALCEDPPNRVERAKGRLVTLHMTAAVLAEQSGFRALATHHKSSAENLIAADKSLIPLFTPAMDSQGHDTYDRIPIRTTSAATANAPRPAGVRAESRAKPQGDR